MTRHILYGYIQRFQFLYIIIGVEVLASILCHVTMSEAKHSGNV